MTKTLCKPFFSNSPLKGDSRMSFIKYLHLSMVTMTFNLLRIQTINSNHIILVWISVKCYNVSFNLFNLRDNCDVKLHYKGTIMVSFIITFFNKDLLRKIQRLVFFHRRHPPRISSFYLNSLFMDSNIKLANQFITTLNGFRFHPFYPFLSNPSSYHS